MAEVEFIYNGIKTIIHCELNTKMKDICNDFKKVANINDNINIFYSYNGQLGFNEELTFYEVANPEDKRRNKMNILVFDNQTIIKENKSIIKSKNIICPECKESIKMDIIDYKINLYECYKKHKINNLLLNEFEKTQYIDLSKIMCNICKKNNKYASYNNIFYKCLTCHNNICPLCKEQHDKSHIIINYDDKYYICDKHNENYILYCEDCKMNLCTLCNNHINHYRILFSDILPNKDYLNKKIDKLKNYLKEFDKDIDILINILNEVRNKINIYYKINKDIIDNYNIKNRNYEYLYYLNCFQKDDTIINELRNFIEYKPMEEKFKDICNLYTKMNFDEITLIYKVKGEIEVQLFNKGFVERNKKNCKLIIEGKEQEFTDKYRFGIFFGTDKDIFEIKLKGITKITSIKEMFYNCSSFLTSPDISKWNTSNITEIDGLFYNCHDLKSLPDLNNWDISNITNMSYMFYNCINLKSIPNISEWNTSNVTDMNNMFSGCRSLLSLSDISKWNTSNVTDMNNMYSGCRSLLSLPDISKWNTSNVINMSQIFGYCESLKYLPDISKWNTSNITNMNGIFSSCKSLASLPDISKWNTSKVIDMGCIFNDCKSLFTLSDISKWDTSNTIIMNCIFRDCESLLSLPDISKWNISKVKNLNCMFYNCSSIKSLPDISKWDTSRVNNMDSMFFNCSSLQSLPDISKWNTSRVIDIKRMFFLLFIFKIIA